MEILTLVPESTSSTYRSPFLRDFIHLNVAMMTSNNALVPDPDKQDDLASQAWQWPILHVGLRMCGWDEKSKFVILNVTNFSCQILLAWESYQYLVLNSKYCHLRHRCGDLSPSMATTLCRLYPRIYRPHPFRRCVSSPRMGITLCSLLYHGPVLPYQSPSNVSVLYVHHYLPALYFAIMVEGFVFDHFTRNLNQTTKWAVFTIAYIAVAGTFIHFRDISFGMEGDSAQWKHLNWLRTWRIADQDTTD